VRAVRPDHRDLGVVDAPDAHVSVLPSGGRVRPANDLVLARFVGGAAAAGFFSGVGLAIPAHLHCTNSVAAPYSRSAMPFTILVIDDDPSLLEMASELLASDGHRPLTASSGRDGIAQAQAERPDLVLLDYDMPAMDGLAVIEKLRADPTTRRIPVVALTSATAEHANALVRAGCIGFIPKPFAPTEFLRLIVEFLHVAIARSRHDPGR